MTAVLSTTAKAAKAAKAAEDKSGEAMQTDQTEEENQRKELEEKRRDTLLEELEALHKKGRITSALKAKLMSNDGADSSGAGTSVGAKLPMEEIVSKLQSAHSAGEVS